MWITCYKVRQKSLLESALGFWARVDNWWICMWIIMRINNWQCLIGRLGDVFGEC